MEVRVVVGLSLLIGLSLGAALIATSRVVTSRSLAQASDTLEAARSAFYVLVSRQTEFAVAQTRLITALPVFRAHISDARLARDGATLDAMVDDYRQQLKAQFCILTDRNGTWTSHPGWPAGESPPPRASDRASRPPSPAARITKCSRSVTSLCWSSLSRRCSRKKCLARSPSAMCSTTSSPESSRR